MIELILSAVYYLLNTPLWGYTNSMSEKPERLAIKDKKVKRLIKKNERVASERDFFELLKRAVRDQKQA
jgi:hypothetical protein